MEKTETRPPARTALALLALAGAAVIAGALLSPWVHRGLVRLGRAVESLDGLRDLSFERVASRCTLVLLVVGLVPALRWAGVSSLAQLGLGPSPHRVRRVLLGIAAGIGAVALILFAGVLLSAFHLSPAPARSLPAGITGLLFAALLVAGIEETLFRGALFGSLCHRLGPVSAAGLSSLLYSAVHFATPVPRIGIAHAHWDSGLRLLPDLFRPVHAAHHYFPLMLTLFLLGLVLCRLTARTGRLYAAIGLHAGLICGLQGSGWFVVREPGRLDPWFGGGDQLVTGALPTIAIALILAALLLAPPRSRPETAAT